MNSNTMLIIGIILAGFCYWDAKKRGVSDTYAYVLALMVAFFPLFAVPFYLILRSQTNKKNTSNPFGQKPPTRLCPKCGHDNPATTSKCQQCGNKLIL